MRTLDPTQVTHQQVVDAVATIILRGVTRIKPEARKSYLDGHFLGLGLTTVVDGPTCAVATEAMLEDWNYHLETATLHALTAGNFQRQGNVLTVTLPDFWNEIR